MNYLVGQYAQLGWTALKTLLLFTVAIIGLRLPGRRMLAHLNVFYFVVAVAVAVGGIVGRAATSSTTSFATGAVALITLLVGAPHRRSLSTSRSASVTTTSRTVHESFRPNRRWRRG